MADYATDARGAMPSASRVFKRRSPAGVWFLAIITLGIYYWVWYYKINRELSEALPDHNIKPGMALLAITLGSFLIIPPYVSIYRTGGRIREAQTAAGLPGTSIPWVGLLLTFIFGLNLPYHQSQLNGLP